MQQQMSCGTIPSPHPRGSHPFEYVTVHKSWAGMFPKLDRQILVLMLTWCSSTEASMMAISWAI
jgi:hypothetical protein